MDTRVTLNSKESFYQMLKELHEHNAKVALLYDDKGLTRYEGIIEDVSDTQTPSLVLQNGLIIPLSAVIAVNGIFVPDYSEC